MLIPLKSLLTKYNPSITGIIHVGAHYAEEHGDYVAAGVRNIVYIEACKEHVEKLRERTWPESVIIIHSALADYVGTAEMHVERSNQGQSNSLLKPGTHTKHYPGIKFEEKEVVSVTKMDILIFNGRYNFLNLDVQGAELMVLKGATETLKSVDYIYTEVNKEQVYEGAAMVEDIDSFLSDFHRVETKWTAQGWGDAFYIRKSLLKKPEPAPKIHKANTSIYPTPSHFREKHPFPYPSDNTNEFERWFFDNVNPEEIKGRIYLPVFWTSFYVKNKYGKNKIAIADLQRFLNQIDKTKKYFTIVQYDDGILNNIANMDLKIFSMAGGRIDYPLPLICEPHKFKFDVEKDIFCSFVGAVTHHCRREIINNLSHLDGYYITDRKMPISEYCKVLARSKYVLCPRGYGKTSFRIMEALQYGAIPVYISDVHVFPHNDKTLSINLSPVQIPDIPSILNNFKYDHDPVNIFEKYFTYESNKKIILEKI